MASEIDMTFDPQSNRVIRVLLTEPDTDKPISDIEVEAWLVAFTVDGSDYPNYLMATARTNKDGVAEFYIEPPD